MRDVRGDLARAIGPLSILAAAATTIGAPAGPPFATAQSGEAADPPAEIGGTWWSVANGDRVVDLVRDGRDPDILWAAGDGGLVRWSLAGGTFTQYLAPQDGLPSNKIRAIAREPSGTLWLATARGLARLDPVTDGVEILDPLNSPGMPGLSATAFALSEDGGSLWVGFEQTWDPDAAHPAPDSSPGAFSGGGIARLNLAERTWSDATSAVREALPPGDDSEADFLTIPSPNITALEIGSDGALWVGSRPFYEWQRACPDGACAAGWIQSGGGLAALHDGVWRRWRASLDPVSGCYGTNVTALAADIDGRMWVGTAGDGMLMMLGPEQPATCASGQAYYLDRRLSGETVVREGLRGRFVRSIGVDAAGRVWVGNGDRPDRGRGIAILDHKSTFHDSSASLKPWDSDDTWTFLDLGDGGDPTPVIATSAVIGREGIHLFGTSDLRDGDGHGIYVLDEAAGTWRSLRTADHGLPSNHITDIARAEDGSTIWFATAERGVARWDVAADVWTAWRAFAPADDVTTILTATAAGFGRVPIDLADEDAFAAAFPEADPWVVIGDGSMRYRIVGFVPRRSGLGPFMDIDPPLAHAAESGAIVRRIIRGPASDRSTRIALEPDGSAWVGAKKKTWQVGESGRCPAYPDCWLDGGVARHSPDGGWSVFDPSNSDFLDRDIASVAIGVDDMTWLALSDLSASGHGLAAYDPESRTWTLHGVSVDLTAGDGAADVGVDPLNGDIWTAHFPIEDIARLPDGSPVRVFYGGGVGHWDGERWRSFTKRQSGSTLRAQGNHGTFFSILVDRHRHRVWAGGWDARGGRETFHWPTGRGVNAVVNWCPLDACAPGAWAHRAWADEGQVGAMSIDHAARAWIGVHRRGLGIVPARGGIKLNDGDAWTRIDVDSTAGGLSSNDITALETDLAGMWVGTLASGAALWRSASPPEATSTPRPTASFTPGTPGPTVTTIPEDPSPTPPIRPTSDEPTPTAPPSATPPGPCGAAGICKLHLPFAWRPRR